MSLMKSNEDNQTCLHMMFFLQFMDSVRKFYAELPVASIDPYTAKVSGRLSNLDIA